MKKFFAVLLALGMLCAFAACGGGNDETTTTDPLTTEPITTTNEPDTTTPEPDTSTTEPGPEVSDAAQGAPVDPTTLDKAALVNYFNEAANRVRTEKPAFLYEMTNKIIDPKLSGFAGILNPIVKAVVNSLMPGDTESYPMKRGQDNSEHFLSLEKATASSLKTGDVTSIRAEKSGTGYTITVKLGSAVNPAKNGASAYSRLFEIKTPKETVDKISGEDGRITADPNNVKLDYHSGIVVMTVDAQGRVTGLTGGFDVKAVATDAKMIGMTVDFSCDQTSRIVAKNFVW